jgi:hypothetical protein
MASTALAIAALFAFVTMSLTKERSILTLPIGRFLRYAKFEIAHGRENLLRISHERCLGDLQIQASRIEAGFLEDPDHGLEQTSLL